MGFAKQAHKSANFLTQWSRSSLVHFHIVHIDCQPRSKCLYVQYAEQRSETFLPDRYILYASCLLARCADYQPRSLASSTIMTSTSKCLGERLMTLWTVRSRVLHASLWNTMTMLVFGRSSVYTLVLQLMENKERRKKRVTEQIKVTQPIFFMSKGIRYLKTSFKRWLDKGKMLWDLAEALVWPNALYLNIIIYILKPKPEKIPSLNWPRSTSVFSNCSQSGSLP